MDKTLPGTFTGTALAEILAARGVDHLTICGYMTNVCCDTTARQALHMGLGATILHDATGVPAQPSVDGLPLDPETIHRAALARWPSSASAWPRWPTGPAGPEARARARRERRPTSRDPSIRRP